MSESSRSHGARSLPSEIRREVDTGYLPPGTDPASLRMIDQRGPYADREVAYFRVFDAEAATRDGIDVRTYQDLDDHLDLVVRAGHVEPDGTVVMAHGRPVGVRPIPHLPSTE